MRWAIFVMFTLLLGCSCRTREKQELHLFLPKDTEQPEQATKMADPNTTLTIILSDANELIYYRGVNFKDSTGTKTDFSYIGGVIRKLRRSVGDSLLVLIKPGGRSTYKNTVDILDQMAINDVKRYAMIDLSKEEAVFFKIEPATINE